MAVLKAVNLASTSFFSASVAFPSAIAVLMEDNRLSIAPNNVTFAFKSPVLAGPER